MSATETLMMPRKCISYNRFSGRRQEAGDSEDRQDRLALQAAAEEGLPLDTTIRLRDKGVSAFRGRNWRKGDLGKFLDLVDAKLVPAGSVLIIEQVNRLSRLPWLEQAKLWEEILRRGIVIRTCVPPARYTLANINELSAGCPVVIAMMLAHQESKQKSEWVTSAAESRKRRAREGEGPHGGVAPGWVRRLTRPHPLAPKRLVTVGYELIPERCEVLRWMHERCQEDDWGARQIAKALRERGVPCWGKRRRAGDDLLPAYWTSGTVKRLLASRAPLGEWQPTRKNAKGLAEPDGPAVPGHYPVVPGFTEDFWRRTRAAIRGRANRGAGGRPSRAVNLLAGLAFDAAAGLPLWMRTREAAGRLGCYLWTETKEWCAAARPVERAVLALVAQLRARDVDGGREADARRAAALALQAEVSEMQLDLADLNQQLRQLGPGRRPRGVVARIAELEEEVERKAEELRAAKEASDTSTRVEALEDLRPCLDRYDEVEAAGDAAALKALRQRIHRRLGFLVESVWVRVEDFGHGKKYVHVRLYLHGGDQRYTLVTIGGPAAEPLPLEGADFRGGAERDYAAHVRLGRKAKAKRVAVGPRVG